MSDPISTTAAALWLAGYSVGPHMRAAVGPRTHDVSDMSGAVVFTGTEVAIARWLRELSEDQDAPTHAPK